ncbi:MAG: FtsX-like permease family protein, partial [Bacteroidota bacterium]
FPVIITVSIIYGILTSILPALIISKLPITESIKGAIRKGSSKYLIQKGLIIAQFTASIFLISGTYIVWQQIEFMKKYDLNFDNQNTFSVYSYHGNFKGEDQLQQKLLNIKQRLHNHSQVVSASFSRAVPGDYWDDFNAFVDAKEPEKHIRMRQLTVDPEYFKTLDIEFTLGGNLRENNLHGNKGGYAVLNEAAFKALGWQTIEGKQLREDTSADDIKVLGVTKDFHYMGLNQSIEPMIHWISDSLTNNILTVRVNSEAGQKADPTEVISLLKKEWEQLSTFDPFDYFFLDKAFNNQYKQQERLGYLSGFFSLVAFIIASLGLFSLSAFMIRKRKKEIGIRKILGATVYQLFILLSKNFMVLILIALVISIPLVIQSAKEFLSDFAYKVEVGWQLFVLVALFTVIAAIISISFQAIKTSLSNPVDEIKDE